MRKLISGLLMTLVLLTGQSSADKPRKEAATLVEARVIAACVGLDCPPLPVPFDAYLCFLVKDTYYAGTYRPWGFPWAPPGKRLAALERQSVEIVVTDEHVRMVAPFNLSLKRMHGEGLFRSASCEQA